MNIQNNYKNTSKLGLCELRIVYGLIIYWCREKATIYNSERPTSTKQASRCRSRLFAILLPTKL